jgi:hypothetical protein
MPGLFSEIYFLENHFLNFCVCLLLKKLVNRKHFLVNEKHFPIKEKFSLVSRKVFFFLAVFVCY